MAHDTTIIAEHKNREELVPVLTYVYGLSRPRAISAMLSFMSLCHTDFTRNVRLSNVLSAEDETSCMSLLDEVIETYLRIENLTLTVQDKLGKTVYKILKKLHGENLDFLKKRFVTVCGAACYLSYWKRFEQASCFKDISLYMTNMLSAMQRKRMADFSIFFIALTILYGCGDAFYERLALLEEKLKIKYHGGFPFDRIGLCLWPLDFSFVQDDEDVDEKYDEHRALLKAAQTINPGVRVQVCVDSLLWSRDITAWLSDDFDVYAKSDNAEGYLRFGRGALNEGGNVITGTAREKFVLVAQGPLSDNEASIDFHYEMFNRDIRVYIMPDGFLWSRDPVTGKDLLLDSIHIDAVFNVVPARYTLDGKLKIIVDPYYYAVIKENAEFGRFLKEQNVPGNDVVIVDERELYLNLPNFSVLCGRDGEHKLLFNKDKGHTLPRLNLRADLVVQPDIEITKMASGFGAIRCATAMLPLSYVRDSCALKIKISNKFPAETKMMIKDVLQKDNKNEQILSKLWVSKVFVRVDQEEETWEFDGFSRTMHMTLTPAAAAPGAVHRSVCDLVADFARKQSQCLWIHFDGEDS
jgi:hypothetical protein